MDRMNLSDRALCWQIRASHWAQHAVARTREAMRKAARNEAGQTPTEYLMIVGFMAAVIVAVFVIWYWQNVEDQAQSWSQKVGQTVGGDDLPKK
jgi:Flp pilus assembly pilin Flp